MINSINNILNILDIFIISIVFKKFIIRNVLTINRRIK